MRATKQISVMETVSACDPTDRGYAPKAPRSGASVNDWDHLLKWESN